MRFVWSSLVATIVVASPLIAQANGRFPNADQLIVDPGDPSHLVLRATFGLLQSMDGGASWTWVCEDVIGYGGMDDPAIAVSADGTVVVGVNGGIATTKDRGCVWSLGGGPADGFRIVDVSTERSDPTSVLAITADDAEGDPRAIIVVGEDDTTTWSQLGVDLLIDFEPQTLDSAPSDPTRLYVTGNSLDTPEPPLLLRSEDRGETWTTIPFSTDARRAYIGAIDPMDPDRVYVRLQGEDEDTVIVSDDAGETWNEVLTLTGPMLGFALSTDGTTVAAGTKAGGLYVADTTELAFVEVSPMSIRCLTWSGTDLYACASEVTDGMTVGLSTDDGETFTALYHLADLEPLECAAGSPTQETCPPLWPAIEETLGVTSAGGGSATTATTGGGGSGGGGGTDETDPSGGCSCAAPATEEGSSRFAVIGLLAALGASVLRRRTIRG